MPFSHGKDGGGCVFPVLPQGRGLPLLPGFGRLSFYAEGFALRGDLLCPRRRRRQNAAGGVPRSPHGSSGATPGPRLRGLPLHPSAEVPASRGRGCRIGGGAGRSRFYKQRAGGSGIRPYGGFGELQKREQREGRAPPLRRFRQKKAEQGRHRETKRTKPQNIPGLRPFYPHCARLRSFISCSYSRREASASLDMGRMTKMLKMVIRPMPTSPRSHTKV